MTGPSHSIRAGEPVDLLECVVNVSEGQDERVLSELQAQCGAALLDVHRDPHHNRSVFTLAGASQLVEAATRDLSRAVVRLLDLDRHTGAHPRIGVLDVVPWVALEGWPVRDASPGPGRDRAREARDSFARWAAGQLDLPVFLYGPERSLPELRRGAWRSLRPDLGPATAHTTAGAVAVGCRPLMVAYNLWLADDDMPHARAVAASIRSPQVRALAFSLGGRAQVSCNLVAPLAFGPAGIWDQVAHVVPVARAELVGLVPAAVLEAVPRERWAQLGLSPGCTIEERLAEQK